MSELPEPEAFRFNYDGYGWDYRDSGSGSSWKDMATADHAEFMFTESQLRDYGRAEYLRGLEQAAKEFDRRGEPAIGWYETHEPAEIIRALKEQT
jgi:hypothetical protein